VNFVPVTPEFKRMATFALLLYLAGIITKFFWVDYYSVLFHLYARERHCYAARATRIFSFNFYILKAIAYKALDNRL